MSEIDPLVLTYSHLPHLPQPSSALHLLRKIASLVKPLMRARGWRVRELGEFYPEQENLLGLNINRGAKILLRLRYPSDKSLFLPVEQVTDTMLHELAHIVHGPHDGKFHALWNQLRDEHEGLVMKGYTGEGFLSEGRRLGGSSNRGRIPMHEARRLAREQAEKRKVQTTLSAGSGQRLGGARPRPGEDIRRVIVDAVERRNKTLKGCGVGGGVKDTGDEGLGEQEIRRIEEQATRNGFRSQAEEDEANEAAIAQALWELVQEDEKKKFGSGYVEPSKEFPAGSQGAFQQNEEKGKGSSSSSSAQPPPIPHRSKPTTTYSSPRPPPPPAISSEPEPSNEPSTGWVCNICTLHNPDTFLCCDACGTERPPRTSTTTASNPKKKTAGTSSSSSSSSSSRSAGKRPSSSVVDLTKSPPSIRTRPSSSSHGSKSNSNSRTVSGSGLSKDKDKAKAILQAQAEAEVARRKLLHETWQCSFCGKRMEKQWWTCSTCGKMKDSSK